MGNLKKLFITSIYLIIFGCSSNHNYIIPYDIERNFPDSKNGITQDEMNEFTRKMVHQIKVNTEGKKIPKIQVYEANGKNVILNNLINQKSFIYGTDSHCGWGLEIMKEDLPNTIKKLKGDSIKLFTIALLVRDEMDSNEIRSFNKLIDKVKTKYEHFYIIDKKEAKKLNIMNATKLLIDSDQNVISWDIGASLNPNGLYEELKTKLLLTSR
jgi:hypothetical protein